MHLRSTFSIEKHHTNIGLPWWLISKESACNAEASGGTSSIPSSGKSPGAGHGNPLQYSYLKNPMDRGAWWATIHDATKSGTLLKQLSTDAHKYYDLLYLNRGFPHSSVVKNLPTMQEMWVWPLGQEDPLEEEMATYSNILAWRIPWTEESGGL